MLFNSASPLASRLHCFTHTMTHFWTIDFSFQSSYTNASNSSSVTVQANKCIEEVVRRKRKGKRQEERNCDVLSLEEVHNLRSWPTTLFSLFTPFTFTLFRFSAFVVIFYFATIHLICSSANRTTTWIAVVSIRRLSIDTLIRVREVYLRPVTVVRRRPENVLPFLPTYWSMSSRGEVPLTPLILLNVDA